jgi:hypothetical protein
MLERLTKPITNLADIAHLTEPEQGSEEMNDEPTIIKSLEEHLKEYGHTTVGQDIAAAILVIRELHAVNTKDRRCNIGPQTGRKSGTTHSDVWPDAEEIKRRVTAALDDWTIDDGSWGAFNTCVDEVVAALTEETK